MKRTVLFLLIAAMSLPLSSFIVSNSTNIQSENPGPENGGEYTVVIQGYDWGPAVSKVILPMNEGIEVANKEDYTVTVERKTDCTALSKEQASGERTVIYAYPSDAKGSKREKGSHATLVLWVSPDLPIGSPIQYTRNDKCRGNNWIDYHLTITNTATNQIWDKEGGRIMPIIDRFDLSGKYVHNDEITLSYASYTPEITNQKSPLIIWLHGGGEGGTDPSIPLVANRAANYASDEIQTFFGGAYVLAPQSPTRWMHGVSGETTRGQEDDIYHEALMALFNDFVAKHPDIDTDRIYVGGCSNGGYMTLKLILDHPDYFAAAFPSALAYYAEYVTDKQIQQIKDIPIWFIHSKDDPVTVADKTVVPLYKRLMDAGAKNVHVSFYDHVVDITGFFGGENYHYSGHWSWIYSHANESRFDYDGSPVLLDGRPVTVMEWMAAQKK